MTAPATSRVNITDRAHRYRASKLVPAGRKECARCGSTRFLVPDHKDGYPDHTTRSNLQWLCKSCNTIKGLEFARMGKGRLTNQYNPAKGVPTFEQYAWAVSSGEREVYSGGSTRHAKGVHDEAGAIIHATPKHLRREYARRIADAAGRTRRTRADERWNPPKFDRCVKDVKKKGGARNAYAVCRAAIRRVNPAAGAAEAFELFHGFPPEEVVTVRKKVHHHEHLAGAGVLPFLDVWGIDDTGHKISGFKKAMLCFNEEMNQLFIEGGDQHINLDDFGIDKPHELETLGKVTDIGYKTNKVHLGDEGGEAVYVHKFRSTNHNGKHVIVRIARYPDLIYDVRNEQLLFSGGSYEILREGIDK